MRKRVFALVIATLFLGLTVMPVRAIKGGNPEGKRPIVRVFAPESQEKGHPVDLIVAEDRKRDDSPDDSIEDIEKQVKSLMEELKKLERDVRGKVRKEVLPRLKQEIERLREWLRKIDPKREQNEPVRT